MLPKQGEVVIPGKQSSFSSTFLYFHHSFDHTGFRSQPGFKLVDHLIQGSAMGDQRSSIDLPCLKRANDVFHILSSSVSAAQEGELPAVEIRIKKGDMILDQTDQNQTPSMSHPVEGLHHGLGISSRIEYDGGIVSVCHRFDLLDQISLPMDHMIHMKLVPAKLEPLLHDVQRHHFYACLPNGLHDSHPNGTGADHQDRFSFLDLSTSYGMGTDGEALRQKGQGVKVKGSDLFLDIE